jgi:hypothetical protein
MFEHIKVIAMLAIAACGVLFCASAVAAASTEPYSPCGPIDGGWYGPFDYRTATQDVKERVEVHHFPPDVENLIKGATTHLIAGDIDYTCALSPTIPGRCFRCQGWDCGNKRRNFPVQNGPSTAISSALFVGGRTIRSCGWSMGYT